MVALATSAVERRRELCLGRSWASKRVRTGLGFRVLGFRVQGLGFRVSDLGFRV